MKDWTERVMVCDIEADDLLDDVTKIHCLGAAYKSEGEWKIKSTTNMEDVKAVFTNPNNILCGHNFYSYDIPMVEKVLGIEVKAFVIDSLYLAWILEPFRIGKVYGLDSYGKQYGVHKPEVENWKTLPIEVYVNRVVEDVKINTNVWVKQLSYLKELYEGDLDKVFSYLKFLACKGKVAKMQLQNPLYVDVDVCEKNLSYLQELIKERVDRLKKVMPKVPNVIKKTKPKKPYKKDGSLSSLGVKWFSLLEEKGLPDDYEGEVEEITGWEDPNPNSTDQQKDWLFSLGWKPKTFKDNLKDKPKNMKKKDGSVSKLGQDWFDLLKENNLPMDYNGQIPYKVPQIKNDEGDLCDSIKELLEVEPSIEVFEDLSIITHREGILKGFLRDKKEDGSIVADMGGIANTGRWKHRILVNLPKPSAPYGEYIRSCIVPEKGKKMLGSDLSALEAQTRNHFIYPLDPDYVNQQSGKFYDSHIDIAEVASIMTKEEGVFYTWWKERVKNPSLKIEEVGEMTEDLKIILDTYKTDEERDEFHEKLDVLRSNAKKTNYSSIYGIGATKLGKDLKIKTREAKGLLNAYWKKNWSVKEFANSCDVKKVNGQKWILNPLNGYWYTLRSEKDRFSTLNQGAGDYIQTLWMNNLLSVGIIVQGNWHDEIVTTDEEEKMEEISRKCQWAIDKVNKQLNLFVTIGISYKIGDSYLEVH